MQSWPSLSPSPVPYLRVVCPGLVESRGPELYCSAERKCAIHVPLLTPIWLCWGSQPDHRHWDCKHPFLPACTRSILHTKYDAKLRHNAIMLCVCEAFTTHSSVKMCNSSVANLFWSSLSLLWGCCVANRQTDAQAWYDLTMGSFRLPPVRSFCAILSALRK